MCVSNALLLRLAEEPSSLPQSRGVVLVAFETLKTWKAWKAWKATNVSNAPLLRLAEA